MHVISSCAELLYDPVYTCWPNNWAKQAIVSFIIDVNQLTNIENNYLTILCVFEYKGFQNGGGGWGPRAKICHGPRATLIRPWPVGVFNSLKRQIWPINLQDLLYSFSEKY
jgi:hypothetical protein